MPHYYCCIYFNESPGHFDGYKPGNKLVRGNIGRLSNVPIGTICDADTPEIAADIVFMRFNADDRPNADRERSLSVGDVVELRELLNGERADEAVYLACGRFIGWDPVTREDFLSNLRGLAGPGACCPKAEASKCVCAYSYTCPDHEPTHVGTHD